MRKKNAELMEQIISFINQYYSERHSAPSVNSIAQAVHSSKATIHRYLVDMHKSGLLEYDGANRTIVTKMIRKFSPDSTPALIMDISPCDKPETETNNTESYVSLPVSIFGQGDYYIFKAPDNTMTDAGIDKGDLVVISRQTSANVGDIVVVPDENHKDSLKLFAGTDAESGESILRYCNKEAYPNKELRVQPLTVLSVAKRVIKSLEPNE